MTKNNQLAFNLSANDVYSIDWVKAAEYTKDWKPEYKMFRPTPCYIKEIFDYNYDTGKLYWKKRKKDYRFNSRFANKEVSTGSSQVNIIYKGHSIHIQYHHIVWCWVNKEWVDKDLVIDHINGDPKDNRIENLRIVTKAENSKNRKTQSNNTSGYQGVIWDKHKNKWTATIKVNNKHIWLGSFVKKEDAIKVRQHAEIKYDFHENHGRS